MHHLCVFICQRALSALHLGLYRGRRVSDQAVVSQVPGIGSQRCVTHKKVTVIGAGLVGGEGKPQILC